MTTKLKIHIVIFIIALLSTIIFYTIDNKQSTYHLKALTKHKPRPTSDYYIIAKDIVTNNHYEIPVNYLLYENMKVNDILVFDFSKLKASQYSMHSKAYLNVFIDIMLLFIIWAGIVFCLYCTRDM